MQIYGKSVITGAHNITWAPGNNLIKLAREAPYANRS